MPHTDDLNDAVLVGMAIEDDARALFAVHTVDMSGVEPWEKQSERYRANFTAMATALRARYMPEINAAAADAIDAARWRALMGCSLYTLGSAGLTWNADGSVKPVPEDRGYIHAGINFTTQVGVTPIGDRPDLKHQARGRATLTAIADQIIAQGGEAWVMKDGKRVEPAPSPT